MRARRATVTKEKPFVLLVSAVACAFAVFAVLYLTLSPTHLPNFLPGHVSHPGPHPPVYLMRAMVCSLVAIVLAFDRVLRLDLRQALVPAPTRRTPGAPHAYALMSRRGMTHPGRTA